MRFYREAEGGGFKARIYFDTTGWRVEVESRDASMSFSAACRTVETCRWFHNMFLTLVNMVAVMVENPSLVFEVSQFIQSLYREGDQTIYS